MEMLPPEFWKTIPHVAAVIFTVAMFLRFMERKDKSFLEIGKETNSVLRELTSEIKALAAGKKKDNDK